MDRDETYKKYIDEVGAKLAKAAMENPMDKSVLRRLANESRHEGDLNLIEKTPQHDVRAIACYLRSISFALQGLLIEEKKKS